MKAVLGGEFLLANQIVAFADVGYADYGDDRYWDIPIEFTVTSIRAGALWRF